MARESAEDNITGPALRQAERGLKSRRAEERLRAICELERLGTQEANLLLVEGLKDRLSYVGAAAARALAKTASSEIAAAMVDHFTWASEAGHDRDPGCSVRIELAVALGNLRYTRAEGVLRTGIRTVQVEMVGFGLEDTGIGLRANCALALAQIRPPDALLALALLLFDAGLDLHEGSDTLTARRAAARAIGHLGDPAGSLPLVLKLSKPTSEAPDVLVECMNSLVALEAPYAVEYIQTFLQDSTPFLVASAAMALSRTRDRAVLPLLLAALDKAGSDLVEALAAAVAALRLSEARNALLERTYHQKASMRAASALALGVFPDQEAQDRLRLLAESDPHSRVQKAAATALGERYNS